MEFHRDHRRRKEVLRHLQENLDLSKEEAHSVVRVYEQSGLKKANLQSLPSLWRITDNIRHGRDPLARLADFGKEEPSAAQGKWASRNGASRAASATQATSKLAADETIYCPPGSSAELWKELFANYVNALVAVSRGAEYKID